LKYKSPLENAYCPIFNRLIDLNKSNIFLKKEKRYNIDLSEIINLFSNSQNNKLSKINPQESKEILKNTLEYFNIIITNDYIDLEEQLINFISNDSCIVVNEKKLSKTIFTFINIVITHNGLLIDFIKTDTDINLELEDKGTAFSSNKNTSETINPILSKYESVYKVLNDNSDIKGIINLLKAYKNNSYELIHYLACFNENTKDYLNFQRDKDACKIVIKIKNILNSAYGLKKEDFSNSLKFLILNLFRFNDVKELGFTSQEKLKNFLELFTEYLFDTLEVKFSYLSFDKRDFNQKIQIRDYYKNHVIFEKITKENKKKHPIFDNNDFQRFFRKNIKLTIDYPLNKF